jgi:hypothetical protein
VHGIQKDSLDKLFPKSERLLAKIIIPGYAAENVRRELEDYGIDEPAIYPDLAGLSQMRSVLCAVGLLSGWDALYILDERSTGIHRPSSKVATQDCCARVRSGASTTVAGRPRGFARIRTDVASMPDSVFIMPRADF